MMKKTLYYMYIKRVLDFFLAGLALVILSPVFLTIAILVKLNLGSPIIFKQERPGKDEKIFSMYKFRTMNDRKNVAGELLSDDKRLTKFGTILRSTSLDELPELLNVLKGDMSIIGPRPLLTEYLDLYNSEQKKRHLVRPGLTGLAQVNGRNQLSWEEKFKFDVEYVNNLSFFGDVKIFILTIYKVIKKEGINSINSSTSSKFTGK